MPLEVEMRVRGVDRIQRRIARMDRALRRDVADTVEDILEEARDWMIRNRLSGGPKTGATTSTKLAKRSGRLQKAIKTKVEVRSTEVRGLIFVDGRSKARIYGAKHERGGAAIRPKRADYLTVPINPLAEGRAARSFTGLFVITSRKGNKLLVRRAGDGIEPMYLLLKRAPRKGPWPKRPFLHPTAVEFFPKITKAIRRTIQDAMEG